MDPSVKLHLRDTMSNQYLSEDEIFTVFLALNNDGQQRQPIISAGSRPPLKSLGSCPYRNRVQIQKQQMLQTLHTVI